MTVKELIKKLEQFEPEMAVIGSCIDGSDYRYTMSIKSVELDSPYDDNGYNAIDGSEPEDEIWVETENNLYYVGPKVVVIDLGTV